jgi:integral membrane sensor domain MASE1
VLFVAVLVGYGLLATASYELFGAVDIGVTFFPPAGLTFAALIVLPRRLWWTVAAAIVVAEITVNVSQGNPLGWSASWAAVNLIEPLVGASVVRHLASDVEYDGEFVRAFAFGAVTGPAVGAIAGATVQVVYGDDAWLDGWFAVWVGDGLGILVVAPLVLALTTTTRAEIDRDWSALGAVAAVAGLTVGIYATDEPIFGYLVIPVLAWSALRLGPLSLSVLCALVATTLTSATAHGRGPRASSVDSAHDVLVRQQVFLLVAIGGAWLLGVEGRKKAEAVRAASRAERELEIAQEQAADTARLVRLNGMLASLTEARTQADVAHAVTRHVLDVVDVDEVVVVLSADPFEGVERTAIGGATIVARAERARPGISDVPADHPVWHAYGGVPPLPPAVADDGTLALPLQAGSQQIGMLWWSRRDAWPMRLVAGCVTIGSLVMDALDRTRGAERDHEVATRLQRAMIPPRRRLSVPGFEATALYRPATDLLMVGGDWYSFTEGGRSVRISVGDVVGHGLDAAATMGRVSSAAHALGLMDLSPCEVIALVEEAAADTPGAEMTTMLQAHFDLDSSLLTYCRAGHLPPLVRLPGERCELLEDGHGPPLGWAGAPERSNGSSWLPPGSLLLCYTDGLVEWRSSTIDDRLEDLRRVVDTLDGFDTAELADHVVDAMTEAGPLSDDVVVVCCAVGER